MAEAILNNEELMQNLTLSLVTCYFKDGKLTLERGHHLKSEFDYTRKLNQACNSNPDIVKIVNQELEKRAYNLKVKLEAERRLAEDERRIREELFESAVKSYISQKLKI